MSTIVAEAGLAPAREQARARLGLRLRRHLGHVGVAVLSLVIVVWTITPIYNMVLISLEPEGDVFTDHIVPRVPSFESFWGVLTQDHWYLENFWRQFGNSVYIGAMVTFLALLLGSLTSFSIGRMRIRHGWLVSNAALLTYVIPASFLAIPFYRIMQSYGLANNPWSVIASLVAFATPYAIFVFREYGRSIPIEVDESARIDGASPPQIYLRIYLPLMAPALVAVGTYAMLLSWNEFLYQFLLLSSTKSMTVPVALAQFLNSDQSPWNYMMAPALVAVGTYAMLLSWNEFLYQFLLLSSTKSMTVPVALAQFLNSDQSPWNYMMATAIIYAIPPVVIYYMFRRRMAAGLTMGGVKG